MKKFIVIIILNLKLNSLAFSKSIEVNTLFNDKKNYEKMEMLFGDYRIYTHRPGAVKIRRISDNKQLVVFSDKFKVRDNIKINEIINPNNKLPLSPKNIFGK